MMVDVNSISSIDSSVMPPTSDTGVLTGATTPSTSPDGTHQCSPSIEPHQSTESMNAQGEHCDGPPCGMRDSPFHILPPELRNNIWELVFDGLWESTTIRLFEPKCRDGQGYPALALLLTCKRINHEAQGIAWRGARVSLEHARFLIPRCEGDSGTEASSAHDFPPSVRKHAENVLTQLGSKLRTIVEIECDDATLLGCSKVDPSKYPNEYERMSWTMDTTVPEMVSLRRVQITNETIHQQLTFALATSGSDAEDEELRQQISQMFHVEFGMLPDLMPGVEELEFRSIQERSKPITWRINGRHFTHLATGTVWHASLQARQDWLETTNEFYTGDNSADGEASAGSDGSDGGY